MENKEQEINELIRKATEALNLTEISDLIKSNEKVFEINGIIYRIKKPTYKQKQEVYKKRIEKFSELIKNDKYLLEKDLKTQYLKRGIDIDKINLDIRNKVTKRDDLMLKLGEEIKNSAADNVLELLKKEIKEYNTEIQEISLNKSSLLEYSIEQQMNIFVFSYFAYLLAEKKDGENWVRVWNSYEEYENGEQEIINSFSYYATMLVGYENM